MFLDSFKKFLRENPDPSLSILLLLLSFMALSLSSFIKIIWISYNAGAKPPGRWERPATTESSNSGTLSSKKPDD